MRWMAALATVAAFGAGVPQQDARLAEPLPNTDTHFRMPVYKTLAEWEARKEHLRKQILSAAGPAAHAREDGAPPAGLRPRGEQGLLGREGAARDHARLLAGRQPLPPGGPTPASFPASSRRTATGPTAGSRTRPTGSIPARCINLARQGYVVFAYDMVGYNDTIQTPHAFGGPREQLWAFGPLGLAALELHPRGGLRSVAAGCGPRAHRRHRRIGRRHADLPAAGGGRARQGFRAGEHDLRHHAGRLAVRERARPARGHLQRGDRRHDGAAPDADGFGHRRLDPQHAARGVPGDPGASTSSTASRSNVETVQIDAPHNYNQQSREAVYRSSPSAPARREGPREVRGAQLPAGEAAGPALAAQPHAAGGGADLRPDPGAVDRRREAPERGGRGNVTARTPRARAGRRVARARRESLRWRAGRAQPRIGARPRHGHPPEGRAGRSPWSCIRRARMRR